MNYTILLALCVSLWKVCYTSSDRDPLKAVTQSNWEFTSSLYTKISQAANPEGNIIFSPLSVQVILALCSVGAGGQTAKQVLKGLDLPDNTDDIKIGFKRLLKSLPSSGKVTLRIENKIFPSVRFHVLKNFNNTAQEFFLSDVENVNYGEPMIAARTINEWVERKTHKKITDIVSADGLDENTAMILVNAVCFKGELDVAFDKEDRIQGTFYVSRKDKKEIRMMQCFRKLNFDISRELGAKLLEVPYHNNTMSLFIILPMENDGLPSVEAKLKTMKLQDIYESTKQYVDIHLSLPIFSIKNSLQLNTILSELDIVDMFVSDADFSGMSPEKGLSVSKVLHTAMIEVNQEGTVAEVAGVQTAARMSSQGERFVADHPFIFALVSKLTNVVLLVGRFTGDEGETRFTYDTSTGGNNTIANLKKFRSMGSSDKYFTGHRERRVLRDPLEQACDDLYDRPSSLNLTKGLLKIFKAQCQIYSICSNYALDIGVTCDRDRPNDCGTDKWVQLESECKSALDVDAVKKECQSDRDLNDKLKDFCKDLLLSSVVVSVAVSMKSSLLMTVTLSILTVLRTTVNPFWM